MTTLETNAKSPQIQKLSKYSTTCMQSAYRADSALSWIESYLKDRSQRVAIGTVQSDDLKLQCGVPQGSVLGTKLYCMYSKPVGEICKRHNMLYHCYADDTQSIKLLNQKVTVMIYLNIWKPAYRILVLGCLPTCLNSIKTKQNSSSLLLKIELNKCQISMALF